LTQKKRIYDLAKEYGMSGQDLAKKLRDRGFDWIKGPMSALDDFQVLQAQGLLEAEGRKSATQVESADVGGGLVLRKKKKKLSLSSGDVDETTPEAVTPAPRPALPRLEIEPIEDDEPAPEIMASAPAIEPPPAPPEVSRPIASAPPPQEIAAAAAPIVERPVEPPHVVRTPPPHVVRVPNVAPAEAPVVPAPVQETVVAASAATESAPEVVQPLAEESPAGTAPAAAAAPASATPRRLGKVVGFIDLSKIKSQTAKKPESRRLRSKDDVAPDVQPTLGHDKKRALVRGDRGTRGGLSAGQLREREAGRFLRRRGPTPAGSGPSSGPRPVRSRQDGSSSPYSGDTIQVDLPITIKKLADKLSVKTGELISVAIKRLGLDIFKVNINSLLDEDTAVLLAHEFDVELELTQEVAAEQALIGELKKKRTGIDEEKLVLRPPTVAFLGHVDHGKTTLIDTIRQSRVAEGEAGGITQHVGAYQVSTKLGHKLTIIDTPGHAAFTQMRARGASAVDIVVLVVAADDGPMPHTEEAIAHARAAKSPIVVALTKVDKAEANTKRAMEGLSRLGLMPEAWGGDTAMIEVSAVKGIGVDTLLERLFLEGELLELKCHPDGPASGVVLEAEIQQGKGIVAHLLVQDGTLLRGDIILAGEGYGKVRSMHDDRGKQLESAPPSMPVEVSGLSALPGVGESFYVVEELSKAKEVAEERERKNRAMSLTERRSVDASSLMKVVADQAKHTINLVVRADVQGSAEVLKSSLSELTHAEVDVRVLFAGVGAVTESDVLLASTSSATIVAFHTGVNDKARIAAERVGIEIRHYEVIYELLDHMHALMEGALAPEVSEEVTGHAEVRALFKSSKVGTIAGSHVIDGSMFRDSKARVFRGGKVIFTGVIGSLRREKDEAKEVREGFDCGIVVRDFADVQVGDTVEGFKIVKTKRTLGERTSV
jgi:translation initiation factor IF-2